MLFPTFILGVVANINSIYTNAIDGSQMHIPLQNSQSEEDPISSSEELQSHLNHENDLTMVNLDEKKTNLDNPLDNKDYVTVMNSDEDDSNSIQILIEKKKITVNANTPVLVDKHNFIGLEKVLEKISEMINLTEDKDVGINDNKNISSKIKYRYMWRIPKYLNINDSEEETESSKDDANYQNRNYYENNKIHSQMLQNQYPFLYTLHNMNNNGNVDESTRNMNKEHPLIQDLGTIVPTEQKILHLDSVSNFENSNSNSNSNSNQDIEPYIISEQIDENPIDFVLEQSKDNFAMESQTIFGNQGQNPLFVLNQIASTNIDEIEAVSMHSNEQQFQLEDINSQLPWSETLVTSETLNDVLVNGGSQSIIDGDFILEDSSHINKPVVMFTDGEMFTLDEIEMQMEFESKDSQNFNLESYQMNDMSVLKSFINDELHTPKNDHIFTLEEFVSDTDAVINNLLDNPQFVLKDKASSNLTSSANKELIVYDDKTPIHLDEQAFILETSTSLSDLFYLQEKPIISQLATNKIVSSADKQLHTEDETKSFKNENKFIHLEKEPVIYSVTSNEDTINQVDPIDYESTSSTDGSYQTHVHKVPQLISPHSKEINTHSANQLPDKIERHSSENSDNSVLSNLVAQTEERYNNKNKNLKLTNEDQENEYHVFHLNPFLGDIEVMPVENISNHYEIKNNNKSYYLIKVEKRPNEKHNVSKQQSLTKSLLTVALSGNISSDFQLLNDNTDITDEFSKFPKLDLNFSNEKDINDKESRIFLTLDDVVDVLADKFTDMLKTLE